MEMLALNQPNKLSMSFLILFINQLIFFCIMNELKNQTNFEINQVINQPYKYGFKTNIEKENFSIGLNEKRNRFLSVFIMNCHSNK